MNDPGSFSTISRNYSAFLVHKIKWTFVESMGEYKSIPECSVYDFPISVCKEKMENLIAIQYMQTNFLTQNKKALPWVLNCLIWRFK